MRERGSLRAGVVGRKGTPRALPSSRLSEQRPLPPLGFLLSCGSFTGVLSEGHERPCLDALVAGRCLQRSLAPWGQLCARGITPLPLECFMTPVCPLLAGQLSPTA